MKTTNVKKIVKELGLKPISKTLSNINKITNQDHNTIYTKNSRIYLLYLNYLQKENKGVGF